MRSCSFVPFFPHFALLRLLKMTVFTPKTCRLKLSCVHSDIETPLLTIPVHTLINNRLPLRRCPNWTLAAAKTLKEVAPLFWKRDWGWKDRQRERSAASSPVHHLHPRTRRNRCPSFLSPPVFYYPRRVTLTLGTVAAFFPFFFSLN